MQIWHHFDWLALILEGALVIFSVRLYSAKRATPFGLLMAACICFVVASATPWILGFSSGVIAIPAESEQGVTIRSLSENITYGFQWLCLILLLVTLLSFLREHRRHAAPTI